MFRASDTHNKALFGVVCSIVGLRERTQEGLTARGESAAAEEGSKDMLCFFQC